MANNMNHMHAAFIFWVGRVVGDQNVFQRKKETSISICCFLKQMSNQHKLQPSEF